MVTKPTGRPRGRPKGSKNKPKTLEALVLATVVAPPEPPPRRQKMKARGPWAHMTPEERSVYAKKLHLARKASHGRGVPGKPNALDNEQWAVVQERARADAKRIMKKMKEAGELPDDPRAEEALEKAIVALRCSSTPKDIASLGRLVLDFTKAKPAQKVDHTIRTHEDFLDELADEEAGEK